jgi:hypothetical protein
MPALGPVWPCTQVANLLQFPKTRLFLSIRGDWTVVCSQFLRASSHEPLLLDFSGTGATKAGGASSSSASAGAGGGKAKAKPQHVQENGDGGGCMSRSRSDGSRNNSE